MREGAASHRETRAGWEHIAASEIDALYTHYLATDEIMPDQKDVARIIVENYIKGNQVEARAVVGSV